MNEDITPQEEIAYLQQKMAKLEQRCKDVLAQEKEFEEFWEKISETFYRTHRAYDDKGHKEAVQFKIPPGDRDLASKLWTQAPDGWFRSRADLDRSLWKVGRMVLIYILDRKGCATTKSYRNVKELLEGISLLEKEAWTRDILAKIADTRKTLVSKENPDLDLISELDNIKRVFKKMDW